jgi:hypothetical protein
VTKATAFEVQAVQQYTESEFGLHASIKDEWLATVLRVVLRALISSMQDLGDSSGAYDDQNVDLAEVGAMSSEVEGEIEEADGSQQLEAAAEQQEDAEQETLMLSLGLLQTQRSKVRLRPKTLCFGTVESLFRSR